MILVDSSIWIDHIRSSNDQLVTLLDTEQVLIHPFVIGELALGNLRQRDLVLRSMRDLPQARVANDRETLHLVDCHHLYGLGIGYVDASLLAAVRLTQGASLWTRDRRLLTVADRLGLATGRLH